MVKTPKVSLLSVQFIIDLFLCGTKATEAHNGCHIRVNVTAVQIFRSFSFAFFTFFSSVGFVFFLLENTKFWVIHDILISNL